MHKHAYLITLQMQTILINILYILITNKAFNVLPSWYPVNLNMHALSIFYKVTDPLILPFILELSDERAEVSEADKEKAAIKIQRAFREARLARKQHNAAMKIQQAYRDMKKRQGMLSFHISVNGRVG